MELLRSWQSVNCDLGPSIIGRRRNEIENNKNDKGRFDLNPYSPTILKNILCFFLQHLQVRMQHNFGLAKPYGLTNQKLCYIQMLLNASRYRKIWRIKQRTF